MRICSIEGCGKKHYGRNYCQRHYTQWRNNGDPMLLKVGHRYQEVSVEQRIRERSRVNANGCVEFESKNTQRSGHCLISHKGRMRLVHRVVWELAHGTIPAGKVIRHRCDNPPCVNPEHLEIGTVADNNRDRDIRGRHRALRGSKNGYAKLSEWQVIDIRKRLNQGESTYSLAGEFGVSQSTIWMIKSGQTWQHVPIESNEVAP